MSVLKKLLKVYKSNGLYHGSKIIYNKLKGRKVDLIQAYDFVTFPAQHATHDACTGNIKLLWFIPDFGIGSGGHLNIFRMIYNLERLGIESDLAICGNSQWPNEKIAKRTIDTHFFRLKSNVYFLNNVDDIDKLDAYHIAMATSWQTAYFVNSFSNCAHKLYFVQDFEPYFYAKGSKSSFAEETYKFGFDGITAGSWLSTKLHKEYKMECTPFSFSYDKDLYFNHDKKHTNKRVFFYARPATERRAFELGILALRELYSLNNNIEIIMAGGDISEYNIPFPHICMDVVPITELSDLYSQCDVALVLSFTNLSLLPLELIASGCDVLLNIGDNNTWLDKDEKLFHYTDTSVVNIAQNLNSILNGNLQKDKTFRQSFLNSTSWEHEAKIVFDTIVKKIG